MVYIYLYCINQKTMEEFTTIQLRLPKEFNYRLDVLVAKLKRDGQVKKDKTKAQILIDCAELGLTLKSKDNLEDC